MDFSTPITIQLPPLLILLLLIKRTFKFLETKNVYSVHSVEQLNEP